MKIDYQLTKQDYIDYNIYHMSHSDTIRRSLFGQRYLISIIFLIMPFMLIKISDIHLWYWLSTFIIVYILWIIFYPKYLRWYIIRRISRMLDEGKNVDMLGDHSFLLTEDGVIDITNFSESKNNWNVIENIVVTREHIFIYINAVMAYIIPIRAFININQKNEFINTLNNMTEKTKVKDKVGV